MKLWIAERHLLATAGLLLVVLLPASSHAQSSQALKNFLKSRPFPQLIQQYAQETIELQLEGEVAREEKARPYRLVPGFRCQVFAGLNRSHALQVFHQAQKVALDSVYLLADSTGLFKVQVGNCRQRREAEILLDKLRFSGFPDAWIVKTNIHVPKLPRTTQPTDSTAATTSPIFFGVQILATSSHSNARRARNRIRQAFSLPVQIVQQAPFWKVVVGQFPNRSEADSLREKLRQSGFRDAWVTQFDL